jgi:hypothetical protein
LKRGTYKFGTRFRSHYILTTTHLSRSKIQNNANRFQQKILKENSAVKRWSTLRTALQRFLQRDLYLLRERWHGGLSEAYSPPPSESLDFLYNQGKENKILQKLKIKWYLFFLVPVRRLWAM